METQLLQLVAVLWLFTDDIKLYIDTTQRELKKVVAAKEVGVHNTVQ